MSSRALTLMETIWIISDGLPGHYNQSIAIGKAIQTYLKYDVIVIDVRLKYKILRHPMRLLANYFPFLLGEKTFSLFYQHSNTPTKKPHFIISTGGNTIFANISLSKSYSTKNIYSGTLKHYRNNLIDKIFTVTPLENTHNNVVLDLPPANVKNNNNTKDYPYYALLIGGNGAGYLYTKSDWQQLALAIQKIAHRDKILWMITTSRRTGREAEVLLKRYLDNKIIKEIVWFSSGPRKVVNCYLQKSRIIFCTEDSLTMISESIYAHKPVFTIQPEKANPDKNDALALEKYQKLKFIIRSSIANLSHQKINQNMFCSQYPDIQSQIITAIET